MAVQCQLDQWRSVLGSGVRSWRLRNSAERRRSARRRRTGLRLRAIWQTLQLPMAASSEPSCQRGSDRPWGRLDVAGNLRLPAQARKAAEGEHHDHKDRDNDRETMLWPHE